MTATVKVLNGEVKAGDTIAYSVKTGASHETTIGTVVEVTETYSPFSVSNVPVLKVRASSSSSDVPSRIVTLTCLDRVVRLGADQAEASPELAKHVEWLKSMITGFSLLLDAGRDELAGAEDEDQAAGAEAMMVATAGALSFTRMCIDRLAA